MKLFAYVTYYMPIKDLVFELNRFEEMILENLPLWSGEKGRAKLHIIERRLKARVNHSSAAGRKKLIFHIGVALKPTNKKNM
jgi:hypothetical protein